ncbi:MAG: T9SS type A sorting domain-containing protein [Crocinitomicaceae bacterium]
MTFLALTRARLSQPVHQFVTMFLCVVGIMIATQTSPFAQCARSGSYHGEMVPSNGCGNFRAYTNFGPGRYFRMPVLQGGSYSVSTCGAPIDTQLTGYEAFNSVVGTHFFYVDDNGPICGGLQSSVTFVPNFTNYTRVQVSQYNCQPGGSASITVRVRQNNNLVITSSSASMCAGDTRSLTATPGPVTGAAANAGDAGTFSGTGVSGSTFSAPVPGAASQVYTITYTFGYCSRTQNIQVFRQPTASNAGPDQTFGTLVNTSTTLAANAPTIGTGAWTVVSGPGTVTTPTNPNSAITGLVPGSTTTVSWTISNGPCTPSIDQMVINTVNLPIELAEFDVSAVDNESVELDWMTASEQDNDYFLVQRSTDMENWEVIDEVKGAGNSSEPIYYRSIDMTPEVGISYYRLRQVDFNGDFSFSGIKAVELFADEVVQVYPNPSSGDIFVEGNEFEIETIQVFDLYGKEVQVERVYSTGKCRLLMTNLPRGVYLVRSRSYSHKVIKN